VHELLLPAQVARAEAVERCRRYLMTRVRRWRLAQAFLPAARRDELVTLLAWHRLAREVAAAPAGFERRRGLDELTSELDSALAERARSPAGIALSFAVRRHELPEELLRRPLFEWRRDEHLATFETREALLAHARAVAVPEARLLLRVLVDVDPHREALADSLALGIQLSIWLANSKRALEQGRLRLPVDRLTGAGVALASLSAAKASPALARAVAGEVACARGYFERGWPLAREIGPWRGRRLAFVLRWHAATLSAIEAAGCDVLRGPPPAGWPRVLACATASLLSSSAPRLA